MQLGQISRSLSPGPTGGQARSCARPDLQSEQGGRFNKMTKQFRIERAQDAGPASDGDRAHFPAGRIAVVVASSGRPESIARLLRRLTMQSRPADVVVLSLAGETDMLPLTEVLDEAGDLSIRVLNGPRGLCKQRNAGLDAVAGTCEFVAFFDDDYLPGVRAIEGILASFARFPEAGGLSGTIIADGIIGPGFELDAAEAMVDAADAALRHLEAPLGEFEEIRITQDAQSIYGCNMAFRMSSIGALRFDERLVLYGWLEDADFSAQVEGKKYFVDGFHGVHCGVKSGRMSGVRLGYSQIANPVYLFRKGTMPLRVAARLIMRSLAANHCKLVKPEAWVDRRGRARGNWIAVLDGLGGRLDPARAQDMQP